MSYLHVFPFSLRSDTPAERLRDHQTDQVKRERKHRLIALGERKRLDFHRGFVGRTLEVLVEDRRDKATGLGVGLSDNYIKALFEESGAQVNQLVEVEVTRAREDLVFGESRSP